MSLLNENIERGVEWLNKHQPGWVDKIDLDTLDIGSGSRCVLGQLYGDACESPFGYAPVKMTDHGFWLYSSHDAAREYTYGHLDEAWIAKIRKLRQDAGVLQCS